MDGKRVETTRGEGEGGFVSLPHGILYAHHALTFPAKERRRCCCHVYPSDAGSVFFRSKPKSEGGKIEQQNRREPEKKAKKKGLTASNSGSGLL